MSPGGQLGCLPGFLYASRAGLDCCTWLPRLHRPFCGAGWRGGIERGCFRLHSLRDLRQRDAFGHWSPCWICLMQADWLQPGFIALVIHVYSRGSISQHVHFLAAGQIAKLCGARAPLCVYLDALFCVFAFHSRLICNPLVSYASTDAGFLRPTVSNYPTVP